MKIILTQDVSKLGRKGEVKTVADGYGRNFIVARGLGVMVTADNLKKLESVKQRQVAEQKMKEELLKQSLDTLKEVTIRLTVKSSPEGHLFAGLHQTEIADALKRQNHLDLDPSLIQLDKPIKQVGEYDIAVKVGDRTGHFKLVVDALP